ncbi:MAG: NAD(P)-dependent oxidoreductase [Leptolyngbya sp. PLA3]|nr:MAG: NAD(P)-dependent oxidoreductase [Cyanobacteria bacterium CYA]MCE7969917.1 NAD(P)-dependent oxidoreductase [Leptolyngbya sp. PL-A3]
MNSAIIGATGFVGRHLAGELSGRGHCAGYDLRAGEVGDVHVAACDIAREVPTLPPGTEAVFYLAQFPGYRDFPKGGGDLWGVNVAGVLRAVEAARAVGARALIYASTGTVYAPTFDPMCESAPLRRDQPYALSKVAGEEALALVDQPRTCCVRLFGVFGPQQATMLVPGITSRIRTGSAIMIEPHPSDPGDCDGLRISLTDVGDVCAGMIALARRMIDGLDVARVVNLAAPRAVSIRQIGQAIAGTLGLEARFEMGAKPRAGDYIADITLLRRIIDISFTRFDDSIARTLLDHAR